MSQLASTGGGHYTRDLVFSPDGRRMFVAVGSLSNVAEDMPKKSADEIKAWEAEHGVGAAWGKEENRADVLVFDVGRESTRQAVRDRHTQLRRARRCSPARAICGAR